MKRSRATPITQRQIAAANNFHSLGMRATPVAVPKARAKSVRQSVEPTESQILKAILQLLRKHPKVARVWRQNSGSFELTGNGGKSRWFTANTAKGMSDIMGILKNGKTLAIEVKRPGGVVMQHQHEFLESISKAGGIAFVARDVDTVNRVLAREA